MLYVTFERFWCVLLDTIDFYLTKFTHYGKESFLCQRRLDYAEANWIRFKLETIYYLRFALLDVLCINQQAVEVHLEVRASHQQAGTRL